MANSMFVGALPREENSFVPTRRASRAGSISLIGRSTRGESISNANAVSVVHMPFMTEALAEARKSLAEGGIPIGCVLVHHGRIVARGYDRRLQRQSVLLDAEHDCLESAGRQARSFYRECTLYSTLAPSAMSSGAIRLLGIPRVVIGDNRNCHGDEALLRASHIQVDVLDFQECYDLLANYIKQNPTIWDDYGLSHVVHSVLAH